MTTTERSLKELYGDYVAGRVTFEDVKRATDNAVEAFEASRGRRPPVSVEDGEQLAR